MLRALLNRADQPPPLSGARQQLAERQAALRAAMTEVERLRRPHHGADAAREAERLAQLELDDISASETAAWKAWAEASGLPMPEPERERRASAEQALRGATARRLAAAAAVEQAGEAALLAAREAEQRRQEVEAAVATVIREEVGRLGELLLHQLRQMARTEAALHGVLAHALPLGGPLVGEIRAVLRDGALDGFAKSQSRIASWRAELARVREEWRRLPGLLAGDASASAALPEVDAAGD